MIEKYYVRRQFIGPQMISGQHNHLEPRQYCNEPDSEFHLGFGVTNRYVTMSLNEWDMSSNHEGIFLVWGDICRKLGVVKKSLRLTSTWFLASILNGNDSHLSSCLVGSGRFRSPIENRFEPTEFVVGSRPVLRSFKLKKKIRIQLSVTIFKRILIHSRDFRPGCLGWPIPFQDASTFQTVFLLILLLSVRGVRVPQTILEQSQLFFSQPLSDPKIIFNSSRLELEIVLWFPWLSVSLGLFFPRIFVLSTERIRRICNWRYYWEICFKLVSDVFV